MNCPVLFTLNIYFQDLLLCIGFKAGFHNGHDPADLGMDDHLLCLAAHYQTEVPVKRMDIALQNLPAVPCALSAITDNSYLFHRKILFHRIF